MTPQEEGYLAKELTDHPAFQAAVAKVKGEYFSEWVDTKWHQRRKREHLYKMMNAVVQLEMELKVAIENGIMAAKNMPSSDS